MTLPQIYDYYKPINFVRKHITKTDAISEQEKELVKVHGYGHLADGDISISIGILSKD